MGQLEEHLAETQRCDIDGQFSKEGMIFSTISARSMGYPHGGKFTVISTSHHTQKLIYDRSSN